MHFVTYCQIYIEQKGLILDLNDMSNLYTEPQESGLCGFSIAIMLAFMQNHFSSYKR